MITATDACRAASVAAAISGETSAKPSCGIGCPATANHSVDQVVAMAGHEGHRGRPQRATVQARAGDDGLPVEVQPGVAVLLERAWTEPLTGTCNPADHDDQPGPVPGLSKQRNRSR